MCCFAGHVHDVSGTDIFARVGGEREYVAYQMSFSSDRQTAMILPIPVAAHAGEDAVQFVPLDHYPEFFRDLEAHFNQVWASTKLLGPKAPRASLKVQRVGAFDASFVPNMDQWDRLDSRFRIPNEVWRQLPAYESFGFVVFKLRSGKHVNAHPMAFSFPTRDPAILFFPTVHIHDGAIHDTADFDHVFYTQNEPSSPRLRNAPTGLWMPSDVRASRYMRVELTCGLVDPDARCFQSSLVGTSTNADVLVRI